MGRRIAGRCAALGFFLALGCGVATTPALAQSGTAPAPTWIKREVAVLQGLDKVTARISSLEAPIDQPISFGSLEIVVRTCQNRPPTETPENAAFLQIDERLPDTAPKRVFSGWMFGSSPGLNALEHPVYDVWVEACKSPSTADQSSSEESN